MASLSIRRLDDEVARRLKIRAKREAVSVEETVRRILRTAVVDEEPVGATIRQIVANDGFDLDLPKREVSPPIDFTSTDYDENHRE